MSISLYEQAMKTRIEADKEDERHLVPSMPPSRPGALAIMAASQRGIRTMRTLLSRSRALLGAPSVMAFDRLLPTARWRHTLALVAVSGAVAGIFYS
ncbi:MAG: hypothetical protein IVW57_11800, partial [Ktedonobacterales bacterium]|nr:hypothetical protein [Ktedonobacterales bacterium]